MTSTKVPRIEVAGIPVEVVRKRIKHLHVAVYPPEGRVRVAAPLSVSDEAIRLAVIDRIPWIKKHQARFASQPRQSQREMVNGETHWVWGRRYRLHIHEVSGREGVTLLGLSMLELSVHPGSDRDHREAVLYRWLRNELKSALPPLLALWQPLLGVEATWWGVRKMKTRWGSCNPTAKRLWFNLELAKKPPECLEYVVVHELVHLIERRHDARFTALMNRHLPGWPRVRETLNAAPLANESWTY